jgi:uncharacterized repeat protein (TIGR01451 family)
MARCKLFDLTLIISSSLVVVASMVALSQAAPATAATQVTNFDEDVAFPNVDGISSVTEGPGLALPPSLPGRGPVLQEGPILAISKDADPDPVNAGEMLTYTIVIINSGDEKATGVVITDPLDSAVRFSGASDGGSYSPGSRVVTWNVGKIGVGETITHTLWVDVRDTAGGTTLSNTAWFASAEGETGSATASTTITKSADLQITKYDSVDPVVAGTSFAYYVTVTNNGPSSASGVTVTDALPSGLIFDASGSSGECWASGQNVNCDIGTMPPEDDITLTLAVSAQATLADGTALSNTAYVWGNESDPKTGNNWNQEWTTVNRQADLRITKNASVDTVKPGTELTYSLMVTNGGPSLATGVVVSDTLPGGLAFDAGSSSTECSATGQDVTCTIDALSVDEEVILDIVVTAETSLEDGVVSNTASVSGNEPDPGPGHNSATADIVVSRNKVFLPIFLKPALTEVYVFNDNTGGKVTFTILGTSVSCVVPNNATQLCGAVLPGTYDVHVISACGEGTFTKVYSGESETTRVFCR